MDAPDDALPARPDSKEYPSSFSSSLPSSAASTGSWPLLNTDHRMRTWRGWTQQPRSAPVCASSPPSRTRPTAPPSQGELALADAAYAHHGLAPPRSELPAGTEPRIRLPSSSWQHRELARQLWNRAMVEFPFVMTCLAVNAGRECNTRGARVTAEPPGRVYNDETLEYSMVVVDSSDLDRISYGLVIFGGVVRGVHDQVGVGTRACSSKAAAVCDRVPR